MVEIIFRPFFRPIERGNGDKQCHLLYGETVKPLILKDIC